MEVRMCVEPSPNNRASYTVKMETEIYAEMLENSSRRSSQKLEITNLLFDNNLESFQPDL
jgi:hypothetical protein